VFDENEAGAVGLLFIGDRLVGFANRPADLDQLIHPRISQARGNLLLGLVDQRLHAKPGHGQRRGEDHHHRQPEHELTLVRQTDANLRHGLTPRGETDALL